MRITITLSPAEEQALAKYIAERRLEYFPPALIARQLLVAGLTAGALSLAKRKGKS